MSKVVRLRPRVYDGVIEGWYAARLVGNTRPHWGTTKEDAIKALEGYEADRKQEESLTEEVDGD